MGFRDLSHGIGDDCCYECHKKGENYTACHDTCEKYLAAKQRHEQRKEMIKKARMSESIYAVYKKQKIDKERKGSKRRKNGINQ